MEKMSFKGEISKLPEITSKYDDLSHQNIVDAIIEAPKYENNKKREKSGINNYLRQRIIKDFPQAKDFPLIWTAKYIDPIIIYQLLTYANHGPITYKKILMAMFSKEFLEKVTDTEILENIRVHQEPEMIMDLVPYYNKLATLGLLDRYFSAQLYGAIAKDYVKLLRAVIIYYRSGNRERATELMTRIINSAIANGDIAKVMDKIIGLPNQ